MAAERPPIRIPLGISRVRGEEDDIGIAEIDPGPFAAAIANTLSDFGNRGDRVQCAAMGVFLADHYARTLPRALQDWLSRYVEFEFRVEPMTSEEFLAFIRQERWDSRLLGVPAVQRQIDRLRRDAKGPERRLLGQWLMGTLNGKPETHDHDWIRWRHAMTRRHLDRLFTALQDASGTVRNRAHAEASADAAWLTLAPQHPVAARIEAANLKPYALDVFRRGCDGTETITNELLAVEERSTASSMQRIGRSTPQSRVKPVKEVAT